MCRVPGHRMSLVARAWLPDLCVPFLRQDRRVSATICRTMHVPPPRLEWHLSGLPLSQAPPINNLSFAEPPTRAALLEQWTLRNVTQDSSLPHASNTLAFRLRPMRPIVAGTPITIRGLRGLNLPTSPPYTPIQTSAGEFTHASATPSTSTMAGTRIGAADRIRLGRPSHRRRGCLVNARLDAVFFCRIGLNVRGANEHVRPRYQRASPCVHGSRSTKVSLAAVGDGSCGPCPNAHSGTQSTHPASVLDCACSFPVLVADTNLRNLVTGTEVLQL